MWMPRATLSRCRSPATPLESMIQLMVGDLQRLRVYAEKGFQVPVEVPEEIWQANERLIRDGYSMYALRENG